MKNRLSQVKLKNLKYEIPGEDSYEPAKDCLKAIWHGYLIALGILASILILTLFV